MMNVVVSFFKYLFFVFIFIALFLLIFGKYINTTYDFYTYQKQHQDILETGKLGIFDKKAKRLLSYRFRKTFGYDGISSCYINIYQLPPNFNITAFLKNYTLTTQEGLKEQYKNYGGAIDLEYCLEITENTDYFKSYSQPKDRFAFIGYHYRRDFLVYGSTKNVHLMDMSFSSPDIEVYSKNSNLEYKPNAIIFDRKHNIVKMATVYSECFWDC